MGINLSLFKKPQAQLKKDIEFVLVDKEAKPRDPNTRNRADMNSRSGGINDPKERFQCLLQLRVNLQNLLQLLKVLIK